MVANVASRLRSKNKLNGTIGFSAVRSTTANATKAPNATTPEPIVVADSQPFSGPIKKPKTAAVQVNVASTAPAASSFIRSFWVSSQPDAGPGRSPAARSARSPKTRAATTPRRAPRSPPGSLPPPTPPIPANTAIAVLREGPCGNVVATSAKQVGRDDRAGHAVQQPGQN